MAEAVLELIQPAGEPTQKRPRLPIEHRRAAYRTQQKTPVVAGSHGSSIHVFGEVKFRKSRIDKANAVGCRSRLMPLAEEAAMEIRRAVVGNRRVASLIVERTFEDMGLAVPAGDSLLVDVVPSYPSPASKDRLRFALKTTMQRAQLAEMPDLELHEITSYGELVREISGGIPPSAYLCPKGDVFFVNVMSCPNHHLPLTPI
jgi:hypothetical protein